MNHTACNDACWGALVGAKSTWSLGMRWLSFASPGRAPKIEDQGRDIMGHIFGRMFGSIELGSSILVASLRPESLKKVAPSAIRPCRGGCSRKGPPRSGGCVCRLQLHRHTYLQTKRFSYTVQFFFAFCSTNTTATGNRHIWEYL